MTNSFVFYYKLFFIKNQILDSKKYTYNFFLLIKLHIIFKILYIMLNKKVYQK